ncbi:hydantoinase/oxoprolinase family protein [Primorskyibacter marinus]|uniref:hydantoinase/oxoprolinase family protein n=1 Tax=Primorskyibacter marinus TaxID=1977320 RepID=UPI000E306440|nr:hydantoinase/oxoprolinase family protein [Primorskyibacter marinus]
MTPQFRVSSDVGGTFTDSVAYNARTHRITVSKVPTTPLNRALGTAAGLKKALAIQNADGSDVAYIGHGMTTATNAVIQRNGARTAFLTTEGFRDILEIGRQNRPTLFDIDIVRPTELVPRSLSFTAEGRLDASGAELVPLNESDVREAARRMIEEGVEAVAVLFLHSYVNPSHERRAREILSEMMPKAAICISTDLMSEFREYERASTTVLNAYLRPVMELYLESLATVLRDPAQGLGLGKEQEVMVMDAAGGLMNLISAREKPVHTVLSGPAGGVVAAAHISQMSGVSDIITMDIGGTSTDISLIRDGEPQITRSATLQTVPIQMPVIDINAIGAGGGSIAWIDDGGALRVGPFSAEAIPGPVCYGKGGDRPTVSDANLVLGRFDAQSRLGGDMALDIEGARRVIQRDIAEPLGVSLEEAAAGILRVAHANIVRGIRVVSVERGHDPRDFALVPFGGAGPMHGSPVARELSIRKVIVPPDPGTLSALGQLISDLRHDLIETHVAPFADFDQARAEEVIGKMRDRGVALLTRDGIPQDRQDMQIAADLRYRGQSFALTVPCNMALENWWDGLPRGFNDLHQDRFGHADRTAPLEVVGFSVTAFGRIDKPQLPEIPQGGYAPQAEALTGTRQIYIEGDFDSAAVGWVEAPVYDRGLLLAGNRIDGPAAIVEISATTIIYPGDVLTVDASGSLIMEVAQ